MSHFSTIQTKIKHKPQLVEALELLQYDVQEDQELINPLDHQHEKVKVDVSIGNDNGFRLNQEGIHGVAKVVVKLLQIITQTTVMPNNTRSMDAAEPLEEASNS